MFTIIMHYNKFKEEKQITNELKYKLLNFYGMAFILFGFCVQRPKEIIKGLYEIIRQPEGLITDYIIIGGIGATFVNAGLLTLISIGIIRSLKINITGVSIASIFLMTGFGMFGKNIFNIWLIILGVFLYAKIQKDSFDKHVYVALFGTSMAPTITEIMFWVDQPFPIRFLLSIVVGISIGLIISPLSTYFLRVHKGFDLYNVGFTAGMIGTIFVSVFKSYGFVVQSKMIWSTGNDLLLGSFMTALCLAMVGTGIYLNGGSFKSLKNIFKYSGRLVSDFVLLEGFSVTLINMGFNGLIGIAYILLVGGTLNGPTIGGILTMIGFGAFGKHAKNMIPIFIGVFLGSITKTWNINDPSILLAALFGTGLAPIAGEYGWPYGVLAGFINSSVVLSVGILHGGLNLYNTGFAAGLVALFLIPIIEAFKKEERT